MLSVNPLIFLVGVDANDKGRFLLSPREKGNGEHCDSSKVGIGLELGIMVARMDFFHQQPCMVESYWVRNRLVNGETSGYPGWLRLGNWRIMDSNQSQST